MGKYLFVMPWGSMELDIEEDEQGLHVVMTSPERNMTVVPEVAERRGDVIVLEAGAGDYGMHFELRDNGNGYDVTGRIPVVGEISGKAAPAEQVAAEEKKRKEEMEQFLAKEREKEPVKRSEEEIDALVEELLSKMTLEEKIGQMTQSGGLDTSAIGNEVEQQLPLKEQIRRGLLGSMIAMASPVDLFELQKLAVEESRLGIPLLYCRDVIHGQETVFPIPLAWACSFDPGLVQEAAAAAAREASSIGVMVAFAPMLDIARDPRWGRIAEGHGEDPYLDARMGEAVVRGYQGDDLLKKDTVGACLKHFLGYGAVEGGRDYNTCEISEVTLRNTYLPPFSAGVRAGASMVMSAFTVLNGRPITASRQYLHDLLRDELGFDGCVVSDYGAVAETIVHGCAEDGADAAVKCLDASVDMEMATGLYVENLPAKVREGVVPEEQIDTAVRRILKLKYQLGIMDCPYRYLRPEDEKEIFSDEKRELSRKLAGESMVLLKNDGLLPVAKDKKIALIGPKAESKDLLGTWQSSTKGSETVTLLDGLTNAGYEVSAVSTAKTGELSEDERARIEAAMTAADVILLALGEDSEDSGEASCLQKIDLPDLQRELAKIACDSGKPVAAVLVSGRPQVITELTEKANAVLEAWFPGCEAGNAVADIISGDVNPSGKLCVSFPKALGQVPVYYNHLNTGRPQLEEGQPFLTGYLDGSMRPLYDFGYGLSYTSFAVENVKLSAEIFHPGDTLTVTADVVNTGERSGAEVLQLYIHDVAASIARPVKELKGFERVELAPGERRQITFALTAETFSFCGLELKETIEPGKVEIFLGTSSRDCDLARMEIVIEMRYTWQYKISPGKRRVKDAGDGGQRGSVKRMREREETQPAEPVLEIAICDDDLPAARELACIIEKILGEWEERAGIRIFTNGPDLLSQASEDQIVFLDVDMPDMDGMEVGRKLREMGMDCPIIIATGMVERFKEAFAIGALRYVTKAFSEDEIREALVCVVKDRIGWRKIRVYDKRISLSLRQRDIDRILAYNSYVLLEAKGHTFRREESLASLERELDGRLFARISRSEIVNMSKVTELDLKRDRIYIGEKECLVSKRCRKDFEEKMMRFDLYDRRKVR